ncbi:MAG: T9SS type A sorting domain-containing protein [Bacteroidales bacterium]|nr:T9SS type A sorting domain-containing protein [Bacteroidales bacterium]
MYKNSVKLSRYLVSVLVLMLGIVLNSAGQYDFMGIHYKGDTVEIPRAKPYKSGKSIPSLDFSIDSIRPLDELVTGNGEGYPWLSPDGNRIYYIEGWDTAKIYMAEKKSGEYRFSNPQPLSFKNFNNYNSDHGIWLSEDELNIYFIQIITKEKTFANLYYAKRDSINQEFSEPKKINLIASNLNNYNSPSVTQDKENLYLILIQDTNLMKTPYLCRFIKTGEDEYTLKDTINIPYGYEPIQGALTTNDKQYFIGLRSFVDDFSICLFKRESLKENFINLYYINNSYVNNTNYLYKGTPYFSLTNNILIFFQFIDYKKKSILFIAYNAQETNNIIDTRSNIQSINIFPNPSSEILIISYQLFMKSQITIELYDITGHKISIIANGVKNKGNYKIEYNIENLDKGIYFVKITDNKTTNVKKIVKI